MSSPSPLRIPFNKPALKGSEISYIVDAVQRGHVSGDGAYTQKCHVALEQIIGARKVLLTTSCTHALEMAALLLNLQPGDEVIVPSFTFVSTINAFVLRGAVPVFVDIRPDTLNMDEAQLERLITQRTRAIVPVHYAGVGCEMDAIMAIAARHGIAVVEDNAHGLFGMYRGRNLGTFGVMATQSFHETKNITCGEGGALVINDPALIERAEIIREKGTNRSRFFRGQVDKYTWVDLGSSYLPSDVLAAYLFAQIEVHEVIQSHRRAVWECYDQALSAWADAHNILRPIIPDHCQQAYHMYYILLPDLDTRTRLIAHLRAQGIGAVFHYLPLHLSEFGMRYGGKLGDCPVTESISDRLLRLPFHNMLTHSEQDEVIKVLHTFSP